MDQPSAEAGTGNKRFCLPHLNGLSGLTVVEYCIGATEGGEILMKKAMRIILKALLGMLELVVLAWGGLNIAKYAIYSEYYSLKTDVCVNPGLNDGFVCQGIGADEVSGRILVSGYMKDDSASRIYITDYQGNSRYVSLMTNGEAFTGHAGGVAVNGDTVYIASDNRLFLVSAAELMSARSGDAVEIGEGIPVNNEASFVFADEDYVYVGEFHDGGAYVTDHPYETPEGMQYAIMSRYAHDDLTAPEKVYSIRNRVQGMCMTEDGRIVLSTSYGVSDSVFCVYNESDAVDSGMTLDGAPVFCLTGCLREVNGPAMAEGLDFTDGKVITLFESASDKYIFGKLFFADKIVALGL